MHGGFGKKPAKTNCYSEGPNGTPEMAGPKRTQGFLRTHCCRHLGTVSQPIERIVGTRHRNSQTDRCVLLRCYSTGRLTQGLTMSRGPFGPGSPALPRRCVTVSRENVTAQRESSHKQETAEKANATRTRPERASPDGDAETAWAAEK
jgi:hypothetical protein